MLLAYLLFLMFLLQNQAFYLLGIALMDLRRNLFPYEDIELFDLFEHTTLKLRASTESMCQLILTLMLFAAF